MLVDPIALAAEADQLAALGVADPFGLLAIDGDALLTTPYPHRRQPCARGRARSSRHGSCGMGIGETACVRTRHHDAPRVARLPCARRCCAQAARLRDTYAPLTRGSDARPRSIDAWWTPVSRVRRGGAHRRRRTTCAGCWRGAGCVFEGAQGVLLDEWRGFHPYTTWSTVDRSPTRWRCWPGSAAPLAARRHPHLHDPARPRPVPDRGSRCWTLPEPHNRPRALAGRVPASVTSTRSRCATRWRACGGVDGLAVTHLDAPDSVRAATGYRTAGGFVDELPLGPWRDLAHQRRLTALLRTADPVLAELPADRAAWWSARRGRRSS